MNSLILKQKLNQLIDLIDNQISNRTVIPFTKMPVADINTEWEFNVSDQNKILGDGEEKDWESYRKVHLYVEKGKEETKGGYKLAIAKMIDGEIKVVYRGVVAAMAALNGARAGVDVPTSERQGIYDNLKKYYSLFQREAPKLRAIDDMEYLDHDDELSYDEMRMLCDQIDSMVVNAIEVKHIIQMTRKAPAWVESKISVCSSKMGSIRNYLIGKITDF